jgi:hypothetical protein
MWFGEARPDALRSPAVDYLCTAVRIMLEVSLRTGFRGAPGWVRNDPTPGIAQRGESWSDLRQVPAGRMRCLAAPHDIAARTARVQWPSFARGA